MAYAAERIYIHASLIIAIDNFRSKCRRKQASNYLLRRHIYMRKTLNSKSDGEKKRLRESYLR